MSIDSSEGNPSTIECPECQTRLKLRNAPTPGKKILCPKCKTSFVVPEEKKPVPTAKPAVKKAAPPPVEEDEEELPVKPKLKKKKKKSDSGSYLAIGLIVGGLLFVGAFGYGGWKLYNSGILGGVFGSKHESVIKSLISTMTDLATVIESVKDESSAQAAVPKIISITVKMAELSRTMKDMKIDARLKIKYESQIRDLGIRIGKALLNVGRMGVKDPAFRDAVMKIQPSMGR